MGYKCKLCPSKAVIYMRQHRLALCSGCYVQWFAKQTQRSISEMRMLRRDERVLVAVSGGKDSLSLWYVLSELGYDAEGLYIDLGISDLGYSERSKTYAMHLADKLMRPLHIVSVSKSVGKAIPELVRRSDRSPCSLCGLIKRYIMNRFAIEGGFDVLATGHNLDDEAATLLSNVLHWQVGYLARQSPILMERDGFVRRIKPFYRFTEKETALYALLNGIAYIEDECPYSVDATTIFLKGILNQLEERMPGTKLQFYNNFLAHARELFEREQAPKVQLRQCSICSMPTAECVCAFCRAIERVGGTFVGLNVVRYEPKQCGASSQSTKAAMTAEGDDNGEQCRLA
ncbi:MAG: TIGR00269 family protein [Armatimonadota bacterium]|nr:TIGR00269 family protein [Armatimonadota bacterium]MCX7777118.1 TIGR00269 family protein [Armatimonadota bacterium]MDW8025165.1 TIGR00269 family protein [Armatimonadota bacterium]